MTESMFLSPGELVELTGYRRPAQQIHQLGAMKIPFRINGKGKPVVAKDQVTGAAYMPRAWSPNILSSSTPAG